MEKGKGIAGKILVLTHGRRVGWLYGSLEWAFADSFDLLAGIHGTGVGGNDCLVHYTMWCLCGCY